MRQIIPNALWIGHVGDVRDPRAILNAGIVAVVDLALQEPPATLPRDLVYCRFPILDGSGNPAWLLRAAVETTARLVRDRVPTLIYCSSGMSRSPAVAAMAVAMAQNRPAPECLAEVTGAGPVDVSTSLWQDLCAILAARQEMS
jgi:protein-tyrosine phosphatase